MWYCLPIPALRCWDSNDNGFGQAYFSTSSRKYKKAQLKNLKACF